MSKRLLDYDPITRTQTWHEYDEVNNVTTIAEVQDVEPALNLNKAVQNYDVGGAKGLNEYSKQGIKNDWWHVASIPNSVIIKWKKEKGIDIFNKNQWNEVKKLLNDSEYAYLRTGTGRV
ncbi:MAG: hypothetical protein CMC15_16130 [Flavobacteriaceae bacterium]|jgi:hypothetical protein|nr:hypothetical protein [Flavobacteriaceae bacterium]|tara:strand:+ start:1629 stop:1985 length:357 start_codon:yes stop_codon:yes gene_type:complete